MQGKRVFVDFHHTSLLRSFVLLFEKRLGMEVYRPIGMDWYHQGFWRINNLEETARQFLDYGSQPLDHTPGLNDAVPKFRAPEGVYSVMDPGGDSTHRACTLEFFKNNEFDFVIASIPAHVSLFQKLIEQYQPNAKLIVHVGNNWSLDQYSGMNVLASVAPQLTAANAIFYHQEFDTSIFYDTPVIPNRKVYSFVNVIREYPQAWADYSDAKRHMERRGWEFRSYGGQCPDGNMTGPAELANKMREASFIMHVKDGGDGFGHIIHNAYAVGRPVIARPSQYRGQLAEQLLVPGTFVDLDRYGRVELQNVLKTLSNDPDSLALMGRNAAEQFDRVVNFAHDAEQVETWMRSL